MDMMYLDNIKITAYDDDPKRIFRLERVIGYTQALADHYKNDSLLDKVSKLHDYKGTMVISWKEQPTEGEKEIFVKAWGSRIGDGSNNVEHEIKNS